jgi:hypothetical protein
LSITVTVSGANRGIRFDFAAAAAAWAQSVAPMAEGVMKARAPFFTGKLRQGISSRTESEPGLTQVIIYGTASYLPYVLGGTKPHPIPKEPLPPGRALRWMGRGGIGVNFARSVNHPGTKPNDFPAEAMAAVTPAVFSRFADAVKEAVLIE